MTRRGWRIAAAALALAACLAGCASGTQIEPAPTMGPPSLAHPSRIAPDPLRVRARVLLGGMSLEQRIASMLMLRLPGSDGAAVRAGVDLYEPGGIILMGEATAGDVDGIRAITAAVNADSVLPVLVAVDQEGGEVSRVASDPAPGAEVLRTQPPEATTAAFQARSTHLAGAGISVNFGIVADVTADPASFLAGRVLGTDADTAAARVAAAVTGEHGRVLSTLKHFPGHGSAPGDSHRSVPVSLEGIEEWRANDARPFTAGIEAGAELVMFGHLAYPAVDALPASVSPEWHRILREELRFDGITITDDLGMLQASGDPAFANASENAVAAIAAGNTMLLYVPIASTTGFDPSVLVADVAAAVRSGRIRQSQVDRAVLDLLQLRLTLAAAG